MTVTVNKGTLRSFDGLARQNAHDVDDLDKLSNRLK